MSNLGGGVYKGVETQRVAIKNPLFSLNRSSPNTTDTRDSGFYVAYGNSGSFNFAGWYRDASTKKWTPFTSTAEPSYALGTGTSALSGFTKTGIDIASLNSTTITNTSTATFQTGLTAQAPILHSDGSNSAPSMSFTTDTGSGVYRAAAGRIAISSSGTSVLDANATRILLPVAGIYAPDVGTTSGTAPSYSFSSSTTTGLRYGSSTMILSVGGVDVTTFATTMITLSRRLMTASVGTVAAPDIAFNDGVGTSGFFVTSPGVAGVTVNIGANGTLSAAFNSSGMTTPQVSTPILTSTGAITVSQALAMGTNNITTTGTVSLGILTSASNISVTAPIVANNNNISGVNSLSIATLTGVSTVSITQAVDFGSNIVNASDIRGTGTPKVVNFNNGSGYIVVPSIKHASTVKTGNYTITASDHLVEFNVSGGVICTLPAASSVIGQKFIILLTGSGTVAISCAGADAFQGAGAIASITISRPGEHMFITPSAGGSLWLTL